MSIDRFRHVHISDLHFVANPFERGSKFRARSWLAKSHSGDKASLLAESLLTLGEVDVLLATGDLTTDGSAEALQTVRAYLRETKLAGTANRRQTYPITALGSVARTTLVVPGNHDRFGGSRMPTQRDSFGFNDIFGEDDLYPHVEYVGDYKRRPVVIFLVNSVPMPDLVEQFTIMRRPMRIAGGYVPLRASATLRRLAIGCPPDAIKIVALHHHPVRRPPSSSRTLGERVKRLVPTDQLKSLDGSDDFVAACHEGGIRMVLFGHKHVAYREAQVSAFGTVHFLCCPSTLQYKTSHPRGYYEIVIANDQIVVTPYEDTGRAFEPLQPYEAIPI